MERRAGGGVATEHRFRDLGSARRLSEFTPWWVHCRACDALAILTPDVPARSATIKCSSCGAVYGLELQRVENPRMYELLPLWLKHRFRAHVLWALNREHLQFLEDVLRAKLRERPVVRGRRSSFTTVMPYSLPGWLLAAKNRDSLLRLLARMKATIPRSLRA